MGFSIQGAILGLPNYIELFKKKQDITDMAFYSRKLIVRDDSTLVYNFITNQLIDWSPQNIIDELCWTKFINSNPQYMNVYKPYKKNVTQTLACNHFNYMPRPLALKYANYYYTKFVEPIHRLQCLFGLYPDGNIPTDFQTIMYDMLHCTQSDSEYSDSYDSESESDSDSDSDDSSESSESSESDDDDEEEESTDLNE